MKTLIYQSSLFIHVLCGAVGLTSGFIAMIARRKGKTVHNIAGTIFYWAMLGVFLTTLSFFILYPEQMKYQFFLGIGIISFYPAYAGKRILSMKKEIVPNLLDKIAMWLVGICGVVMWAYAIKLPQSTYQILFGVFGTVCLQNFIGDWRLYTGRTKTTSLSWLVGHGGKMTGAFAAATTAFCVNVLPRFLTDYVSQWVIIALWILPGLGIGLWGRAMLKKYRIKKEVTK